MMTSMRLLGTALVFWTASGWGALAAAQVESIDPNPTMPRDVGGRLTYRGSSRGGPGLGRAKAGEENPADTLLRSIEGTNYGRATGHSIFSKNRANNSIGGQTRSPGGPGTLYYARRGAYEDRVYQPARGSYRSPERYGTYYRGQSGQPRARTLPQVPKGHEGRRTAAQPPQVY